MKTTITAALLGLSLASTLAIAHDGGHRRTRLDADKDGYISRTEAAKAPRMLERFDQVDTDKDGRLSLAELRQGRDGGPQRADTDKDGFISRQEAGDFRPLLERFDTVDSNKDGRLSADELHAARPNKHRR